MAQYYEERKRTSTKIIHCKEPKRWDEHLVSDYCNFLLALFDVSLSPQFRHRYCQQDAKAGFRLSEVANFIGMLRTHLKDKVIETELQLRQEVQDVSIAAPARPLDVSVNTLLVYDDQYLRQ